MYYILVLESFKNAVGSHCSIIFQCTACLAIYYFYFKDAEYHSLDQQTYLCKSKIMYALLKVVTKLFI